MSLHIALLTPEYVTEPGGGGAAQAVYKFALGLRQLGHEPEVFVCADGEPAVVEHEGICVERTGFARGQVRRWATWARRPTSWAHWLALTGKPKPVLLMAEAFHRRDRQRPFDFVLSLVLGACGSLVVPRPDCPHLVRVTATLDQQVAEWGGKVSPIHRVVLALWRHQLRHADAIVAPSDATARRYEQQLSREVHVIRTPAWQEVEPAESIRHELPSRFMLHIGRLGPSKGTFDVAQALRTCWSREPELRMVWLGNEMTPGVYEGCRAMWGTDERRVQWLGAVAKPVLYAILQRAAACVLPSHIDNLPNVAIESLMFGIPVIGTRGSSLDELVEHDRSGEIVEPAQPAQLADAMLRMWRGESACQRTGFVRPAVFDQMQPEVAAQRLIDLATSAGNVRA